MTARITSPRPVTSGRERRRTASARFRDGALAGDGAAVVPRPLSRREREVAALVADGCTSREIAERLYIAERTAQNHVQHILDKLGLANRTQIAAWWSVHESASERRAAGDE